MKIWYAASEVNPYAASGGLGDVMGSLPREVAKHGCEVTVAMPLYSFVPSEARSQMTRIDEFFFGYAWRDSYCGVYRLFCDGVTYLFFDNEYYFKRDRLYGYFDDGERFAWFSLAVIEFMLRCGDIPDVLHANDWQTALCVVYPRTKYREDPRLREMKTLFTIHNVEYQGKFPLEILGDVFALSPEFEGILEFDRSLDLMKGAIVCADRFNTVSPNYANELKNEYFAFGLNNIISMYDYKFSGILNGIDTRYFDPKSDDIVFPYDADDAVSGKAKNKAALMSELGLEVAPGTPLVSMITRLTPGKGIDLVTRILDEFLYLDVAFVLLGTGDGEFEHAVWEICARHPKNSRALIKFDRALSKRIYAASDIFLMPSKTEPCGLSQMIACRYGAIPVVRNVGGLCDSIIPYGSEGACGFKFDNYNAHDMLFKLKEAVSMCRDERDEWSKLVECAAKTDFSWRKSSEEYLGLYGSMLRTCTK